MSSLSVRCPHCQAVLKMDAAQAGQATTCAHCGQRLLAPITGAPPIVQAPPLPVARNASPLGPAIDIQPRPVTAATEARPPRSPNPKSARRRPVVVHLVMLALGVTVLAITTLVLLRLTDGQPQP